MQPYAVPFLEVLLLSTKASSRFKDNYNTAQPVTGMSKVDVHRDGLITETVDTTDGITIEVVL